MNAIDLTRYGAAAQWSEQDQNLYNQLPIYLTKYQVERLKVYSRWPKLLKPKKWEPNVGTTMRGVRKDPSPILRSDFLPNLMTVVPNKDVVEVREVKEDVKLYRHDFESNIFHFLPSFQDFLTDHVDFHNQDINEKIQVAADLFYRTAIFNGSPYVWICGKQSGTELTGVPYWTGGTVTRAKTQATLQALVAQVTRPLNLKTIFKIGTVMYNDIAAAPYSGSVMPDGSDGAAFKQKFCLLHGSEVWDYLTLDNFRLVNRPLTANIVGDAFTGDLFGRFTSLSERFELRIAADGSIPAPETREVDANAYNTNETVMNQDYVNAPYGVAFACGAEAYKFIQVGPPPSNWTGMTMSQFSRLDWNGKVDLTKNLMIPGANWPGDPTNIDTNKRGEYIQLIASLAMGLLPVRRRNIVPIIYLRARVSTD
jgi:hypothetical protein